MKKRLSPPLRGITDAQPFFDTPGDACPPGGMENMRPEQVGTGRARMAKRPPLVKTFSQQIGGGLSVQSLISVGKSVAADVGPAAVVDDGTSRESGLFRGQALLLDRDWSIRATFNDTRSDPAIPDPPTGIGGRGAFNCCWDPANVAIGFYLTITKNNTLTTQDVFVAGLNRIDADTGTVTHQAYMVDAEPGYSTPLPGTGQGDLFPNQMVCAQGSLWICAGVWIYQFDADDLTYLSRTRVTWADEVQGLVYARGYLWALITGSSAISGPVVVDSSSPAEAFGQFVRTGVIPYLIETNSPALSALVQRVLPQGTQSGDGAYELHRYFRPSEYSVQRPRGCIAYSFDVDSAGNVFIGRTNQGFGYSPLLNSSHRPGGDKPYVSVARVNLDAFWSAAGTLSTIPAYIAPGGTTYGFAWESDTTSYRRTFTWNGGTYQNDIPKIIAGSRDPGGDSDAPSIYALKYDETTDCVFVGGRRPSPNQVVPNVYCLRGSDGQILWDHDLKGLVQQNAIDVDPTTGNCVVGILRTAGWETNDETPSADKIELAELDYTDGRVVRTFDLTDAVNLNSFAVTDASFGCYDVAVNARGQVLVALAPYRFDD
jgi:hypothetical protein